MQFTPPMCTRARYLEEVGFPPHILDEAAVPLQFPRGREAAGAVSRRQGPTHAERRVNALANIAWYYELPDHCVLLFDPVQEHVDQAVRAGFPAQRIAAVMEWCGAPPLPPSPLR
eukprot:1177738-Prorocentrum_minimum.AAC.1